VKYSLSPLILADSELVIHNYEFFIEVYMTKDHEVELNSDEVNT
jgi:hypothetical protein